MAEREGFEPPCRLPGKTLSRRPRYDHFGTSPFIGARTPALREPLILLRVRPTGVAPLLEECLHQLARLAREHSARDFEAVVQRRVFVRAHGRLDRAGL